MKFVHVVKYWVLAITIKLTDSFSIPVFPWMNEIEWQVVHLNHRACKTKQSPVSCSSLLGRIYAEIEMLANENVWTKR